MVSLCSIDQQTLAYISPTSTRSLLPVRLFAFPLPPTLSQLNQQTNIATTASISIPTTTEDNLTTPRRSSWYSGQDLQLTFRFRLLEFETHRVSYIPSTLFYHRSQQKQFFFWSQSVDHSQIISNPHDSFIYVFPYLDVTTHDLRCFSKWPEAPTEL